MFRKCGCRTPLSGLLYQFPRFCKDFLQCFVVCVFGNHFRGWCSYTRDYACLATYISSEKCWGQGSPVISHWGKVMLVHKMTVSENVELNRKTIDPNSWCDSRRGVSQHFALHYLCLHDSRVYSYCYISKCRTTSHFNSEQWWPPQLLFCLLPPKLPTAFHPLHSTLFTSPLSSFHLGSPINPL